MTLMAQRASAVKPAAIAAPPSLLAGARASTPRGELVELPLLGRAWIELAGGTAVNEIEGATFAEMKRLDLPPNALNALTYDSDRTARTLAWAVRNPDKIEERFGTLDEWLAIDIDLLNACGIVYADVRERLDPIGSPTLSKDDLDAIRLGIEKKNPMLLRSLGVAKLSLYLLTTADPPASSPSPPSSSGES
jgi:hypothetical protein